ncbi:MAG: SDR family NAD(P)-dependent oxidoreductase, partial [Nitrosarchaeum sp.]|nr:SDR family NAD(P)-dependent oxidoreductase [Nitrosarchaeum sp.]
MFEGKKILITGGTGSLGQALTRRLLQSNVETIRIFSRNENKQVQMESELADDRLRFLIGDVRDLPRLIKALEDIDIVFHAAALKHVPVIEYNPFEAIKTNVVGSQNVIDACLHENVEAAICIGTDKAVSPLNTYGATKLLMEKLFVTAMNYINKEKYRTKFVALRYGNVLGSSGSVVPKFIQQIKSKKKITITDPSMTRYSLTMEEALDFVVNATQISKGGEIFVPKLLKAYSITDLKLALIELLGAADEEIISPRPGEKMHEALISEDEMRYTWEFNDNYVIFNADRKEEDIRKWYPNIKKADSAKPYSSDLAEKMSVKEI